MARDPDQAPDLPGLRDPFAVPAHIGRLEPYQPGKPVEELERELGITGALKMASNENPLGPSPRAMEAAHQVIEDSWLYPDSSAHALRRALADRLGASPDEIVVGSGSNEIIDLLVHTFCMPGADQVVTHRHAFISYALAARAHGVEVIETPVGADLRCDVAALCAAFGPRTRIIFLANPNNPTGAHLTRAEVEEVLARAPARALVVLDEAYHEYAAALDPDYATAMPYRAAHPGIVILRTFSKVHGLAGLRVGYALADRRAAERMHRARRPFNVGGTAQVAALAALDDLEHVERSCAAARDGLVALSSGLAGLGLLVLPSLANFVLVDLGREAEPVYQALLRRGIITRPLRTWGLPRHLRLSLAAPAGIARAIDAMSDALGA